MYELNRVPKQDLVRTLVNPNNGKIYDLFRYKMKAWTCLYIKQLYVYIALTNSQVSMEAQLILNKCTKPCVVMFNHKKERKNKCSKQKDVIMRT